MKTQLSNMSRLTVAVLLLTLSFGIAGIAQADVLKTPVSYGFNWYPVQRACGGTARTYDFNHILKASKFNPNLGTLREVQIKFSSALNLQLHSGTNLESKYRLDSLSNTINFRYSLNDGTPGAYFRFSTPHVIAFHPIPIRESIAGISGPAGILGFVYDYQKDQYRNKSADYSRSKEDSSDLYRYTDPTILQEFTGTGSFDIEFGSFAVWDSTIGYHEYQSCGPWPLQCYDPPILDPGCYPRLVATAGLQWSVVADVTYVYDPFTVSMHGPASAQANGPYSGFVGTPIWFNANGSIGYPFQVVLYHWNWGDGSVTTTTDAFVQHVYSQPYQGVVWLTITDQEGAQASDSASVSVTSPWAPGDLDHDGDVDSNDITIIQSYINNLVTACPACDLDGDGSITALDTRKAVLLCTRPRCATQ